MRIACPKEIKNNEFRVGITPSTAHELCSHGHTVFVEKTAGLSSGFSDDAYTRAGATLVETPEQAFDSAELIVKVKEPQACERALLKSSHTLFTYLHLAPDPRQTEELLLSKATCIAYETVSDAQGGLPLLTPMSEIAGRMAAQAGAHCLEKSQGGSGVLLGGAAGVLPAKVLVIGGGVVGSNAAQICAGMGAEVTILDKSIDVLRNIEKDHGRTIRTLYASRHNMLEQLAHADLIIGAVLIPGATAPKLISKQDLSIIRPGSVIVDVAIDQGGCIETSRPTTHEQPTYVVDRIIHYCVANMPGAVARTSTQALNNATLPFLLELANKGVKQALEGNIHLAAGLSTVRGKLVCKSVALAQDLPYIPLAEALKIL